MRVPTRKGVYRRWRSFGLAGIALLSTACGESERPEATSFYDRRIGPILIESCSNSPTQSGCHVAADDRGNAFGNLNMDTYEALAKRSDLFIPYGPYGMAGLLVKAVPPFQMRLTNWESKDPIIITSDVPHAGGSLLDPTSSSFTQIQRWLERGATENNAVAAEAEREETPCSTSPGVDPVYDPTVGSSGGGLRDVRQSRRSDPREQLRRGQLPRSACQLLVLDVRRHARAEALELLRRERLRLRATGGERAVAPGLGAVERWDVPRRGLDLSVDQRFRVPGAARLGDAEGRTGQRPRRAGVPLLRRSGPTHPRQEGLHDHRLPLAGDGARLSAAGWQRGPFRVERDAKQLRAHPRADRIGVARSGREPPAAEEPGAAGWSPRILRPWSPKESFIGAGRCSASLETIATWRQRPRVRSTSKILTASFERGSSSSALNGCRTSA